ncbi:MAG: endonuclease/exonuclease/phosphatase family protein [Actinomycetota bacterium]
MLRRVVSAVVLVVLAVALLVGTWPQLFELERAPIVAQFVSLRGLTIAISAVAVVALLLLAMLSRTFRRFGASVALVLLVFALAGVAILSTRGFGNGSFETKGASDVTVVEWNTLGDAPGADVMAKLAIDNDAQLVSLPETTEQTADAVAALMRTAGHPMAVHSIAFNHIAKAKSTSVLVSTRLGGYHIDTSAGTTSTLPTVVLRPDSGDGPVIVAVHAVAPDPSQLALWRSDLAFLTTTCAQPNVIMAGDFNSTLDHFTGLASGPSDTIGNCADAAQATKNAAVGTWPALLPALLGAPIDHVMTTSNWRVSGMRVVQNLDGAGSDHRPIVVQLSPIR